MKKPFRLLPHVAALSVLAAFALPAAAQSAGSNVFNLGWFHFAPNDSSEPLTHVSPGPSFQIPNSSASISDADTVGLALTHFYTDNFALTLDFGIPPKFTLNAGGSLAQAGLGELGTAKQWSPAVVAKWFFGQADDRFRPFVGAGVTRVWYSDVNLSSQLQQSALVGGPGGSGSADLSTSWAPVANAGLVYNFDKSWSLSLSVSYIPLDTTANITGRTAGGVVTQSTTKLTIDPVVTFLSVGYRF